MRRLAAASFAVLITVAVSCTDTAEPLAPSMDAPAFSVKGNAPIRVMSQNLYLGAELDPLLDPNIPLDQALAQALAQLTYTNFPARAGAIAGEILARMPDVVGLQEATYYLLDTQLGPVVIDYTNILAAYLGGAYDVAVYQPNVALQFPVGFDGINSITYMDGDAILVRHGLPWYDPAADHFQHQAQFSVGEYSFPNLHGWNAVTVEVGGQAYRFINTHLEIQRFREVQEAQAGELVDLVNAQTLPVIMVGDFNSAANHDAPPESMTGSYDLLRHAGLADLWLREAHSVGGLTCCQLPDLSNEASDFDQRLDIVFARSVPGGFGGQSEVEIVGNLPSDRFFDGQHYLWPSDHAGMFATLRTGGR